MIRRILVGVGGTRYTEVAIRRAVELARLHGARLTAVTVVDVQRLAHVGMVPIGGGGEAMQTRDRRLQISRQRIEHSIGEFESACKAAAIEHTVCHETGDPFQLLGSLSRYHDLMIFGLRSIFDCGFGTDPPDVLAHLIEQGVRPMIAVAEQFRPIRRVLLTYSGSAESAKTIKRFVQLRLWPELTLRIITCDPSPEKAKRRLEDADGYCRAHGLRPELHHSSDSPKQQILAQAAEWDADLIVLGNSARNYLMRKIFGQTAYHVIQHADRPLFLSY